MNKRVTLEKMIKAFKKSAICGGILIGVAVVPCLIACCGNNPMKPVSDNQTVETTDQLIQAACSKCHSLDTVRDYTDDDWKAVVDRMIDLGAELTSEEAADVIAHLAEGKSF